MNYAIIGAGNVGKALARAFARKNIEVSLASKRSPDALVPLAKEIGPAIKPRSLQDALKAETILLAIPFDTYKEVAKAAESWQGKLVIDVTNAYGVPPEELDDLPSSMVIARALPGAKLVKAFNHLPAEILNEDPEVEGGHRVLFLASDDEKAAGQVAELAKQLGFAPINLGKLAEGGLAVNARGKTWAPLSFQDLYKKGE